MPVNKIVDVRHHFLFLLRESDQVLLLLAQVILHPSVLTAAVRPYMRQRYRPSRMDGRETFTQEPAVKDSSQKVKREGFIPQTVAMGKKKLLSADFGDVGPKMQDHPALCGEIVGKPDIMVADEEMHFYAAVG